MLFQLTTCRDTDGKVYASHVNFYFAFALYVTKLELSSIVHSPSN